MIISKQNNIQKKQFYKVYCQYQKTLKAYNAIDLDDLVTLPVQLLARHLEVRQYWQKKIPVQGPKGKKVRVVAHRNDISTLK